jgi:hypothetical protein
VRHGVVFGSKLKLGALAKPLLELLRSQRWGRFGGAERKSVLDGGQIAGWSARGWREGGREEIATDGEGEDDRGTRCTADDPAPKTEGRHRHHQRDEGTMARRGVVGMMARPEDRQGRALSAAVLSTASPAPLGDQHTYRTNRTHSTTAIVPPGGRRWLYLPSSLVSTRSR